MISVHTMLLISLLKSKIVLVRKHMENEKAKPFQKVLLFTSVFLVNSKLYHDKGYHDIRFFVI